MAISTWLGIFSATSFYRKLFLYQLFDMLIYFVELGFKKRNKAYYYFINNIVVTKKHAYSFIKKMSLKTL